MNSKQTINNSHLSEVSSVQADLLELPALSKKVKTESDESLFSSTENLLQLELDTIPEKG